MRISFNESLRPRPPDERSSPIFKIITSQLAYLTGGMVGESWWTYLPQIGATTSNGASAANAIDDRNIRAGILRTRMEFGSDSAKAIGISAMRTTVSLSA